MAIPSRRHYANSPPTQILASGITNASGSLTISGSFTGWPATPFFGTLERETANQEFVLVTNITGLVATITRAQDGSTAVGHDPGATFDALFIRQDADEANNHTSSTSGVHGVTGLVVGTMATGVNYLIQSNIVSQTFSNVSSATGSITWPVAFNTAPVAVATVVVGSNDDVLHNWQTDPSTTGVGWRLFQKAGINITGTVKFHWIAIGT